MARKERKRGRSKYRRLYLNSGKSKPLVNKKYFEKYPEKKEIHQMALKLTKPFEFAEAHHWSYNKEHARDVIWLIKKEHMKAHRFIVYDQERKMYRRYDNNLLLDNKESHELFIKNCIEIKDD